MWALKFLGVMCTRAFPVLSIFYRTLALLLSIIKQSNNCKFNFFQLVPLITLSLCRMPPPPPPVIWKTGWKIVFFFFFSKWWHVMLFDTLLQNFPYVFNWEESWWLSAPVHDFHEPFCLFMKIPPTIIAFPFNLSLVCVWKNYRVSESPLTKIIHPMFDLKIKEGLFHLLISNEFTTHSPSLHLFVDFVFFQLSRRASVHSFAFLFFIFCSLSDVSYNFIPSH